MNSRCCPPAGGSQVFAFQRHELERRIWTSVHVGTSGVAYRIVVVTLACPSHGSGGGSAPAAWAARSSWRTVFHVGRDPAALALRKSGGSPRSTRARRSAGSAWCRTMETWRRYAANARSVLCTSMPARYPAAQRVHREGVPLVMHPCAPAAGPISPACRNRWRKRCAKPAQLYGAPGRVPCQSSGVSASAGKPP